MYTMCCAAPRQAAPRTWGTKATILSEKHKLRKLPLIPTCSTYELAELTELEDTLSLCPQSVTCKLRKSDIAKIVDKEL